MLRKSSAGALHKNGRSRSINLGCSWLEIALRSSSVKQYNETNYTYSAYEVFYVTIQYIRSGFKYARELLAIRRPLLVTYIYKLLYNIGFCRSGGSHKVSESRSL